MARIKRPAPTGRVSDTELITASSAERSALKEVERLLTETPQGTAMDSPNSSDSSDNEDSAGFTIQGPGGRQAPVTASLRRAVLQFVRLAQRRPVQISPRSRYLTTTQAAQVLEVSRPYLIKLIESGEIPGEKVGTKRRIAAEDLLAYKGARDARNASRRAALERVVEMSGETDIDLAEIEDFYRRRRRRGGSGGGDNQAGEDYTDHKDQQDQQDAPRDVPRSAS